MKRLLVILLMLLLLTGCTEKAEPVVVPEPAAPNPAGYMTPPQILVDTSHQYKEESWLEKETELTQNQIVLQGSSLHVTVIFYGDILGTQLKKAITLEGFEGTPEMDIRTQNEKTVFYASYRDLVPDKTYKLMIAKSLTDAKGKVLEADIQKEIVLKKDTTAIYTLVGANGSYGNLGNQATADPFAVGDMNLTPDSKQVMVDFSQEVDRASVEKSILEGVPDIKVSFDWESSSRLKLKLSGFEKRENTPYNISMSIAKDIHGNSIYGNLFFLVGPSNQLGYIDRTTNKNTVLKTLPDKRYMAIQNDKIGGTLLLDDSKQKYVYHLSTGKLVNMTPSNTEAQYTNGIPGYSFLHSWLDSDHILLYDRTTGDVLSYSLSKSAPQKLFTLPEAIQKCNIIELAASPDKEKVAIAYETQPVSETEPHDFYLKVFDLSGKSIYESKNQYIPRFMELFGSTLSLQWQNDETLIMEDNASKEGTQDYNVVSINIKTGAKAILAAHAFLPKVLRDSQLVKVESFYDFYDGQRSIELLKEGKPLISFKAQAYQYENFFFADSDTLVYNEKEKIWAYHIAKGTKEQIGKGYILGLSEDGSKVYYMTNQKMLYYID